jgi:hypothetical protein
MYNPLLKKRLKEIRKKLDQSNHLSKATNIKMIQIPDVKFFTIEKVNRTMLLQE